MTKKEVENIVEDMWHNSGWKTIVRWHLSELKKAELRARIDEHGSLCEINPCTRCAFLQSELRKMKE